MSSLDQAAASPPILELDQVSVALSGRQILDEVSFSIGAGQFTGLIGANGAGKTTLLRVILGLQRPASGQVLVLGNSQGAARSRSVGYVPQKVILDPDMPMRARDLVALGLDGHRYGRGSPHASMPRRSARCCTPSTLTASPTSGSATCPAESSSGS
jgi:zinc/manganese transport system ATP-binding protein